MQGTTTTTHDEDRVFRALVDPSRRALFQTLSHGPQTVKALTAQFELSQPAISQHLAVLREAGLVRGERTGREVVYRVEPAGLRPLVDWIAHYRAFWMEHVDRLERLLEQME